MISKSDIKFACSLSQKKFRDEFSMFIVEGEKMVEEAINSDFEIVKIYSQEEIGEREMSRISMLSSPSPILAVLKQKINTSIELPIPESLSLILDSVRDPGNLGTIIRIADWFGIDYIFASEDTVDIYNPKVVQASMGSIFRKQIHYTNIKNLLQSQREYMPIYGTFLNGVNIYNEELSKSGMIILGNESTGISTDIEKLVTVKLNIPSFSNNPNKPESLNVAIAASIVCSEFRRSFV